MIRKVVGQKIGKILLWGTVMAAVVAAVRKVIRTALPPRRGLASQNSLKCRRIVILGAGFGGIQVSEELAKLLPPKEDRDHAEDDRDQGEWEIVVVDRNNFLLFTPMLTEVAGGQLDPSDVVAAIRRLSPRIRFEQGRVDKVDLKSRTVTLTIGATEPGVPEESRTLEADHLVIALGSVTNFHDLPGVSEYSLTIKSLGDAAAIRNRALALLERANAEPDGVKRRALLTVVVGGGGFSGVETMAAVNDLLRDGIHRYPNLQTGDVQSILIHPGERLLPELGERLAAYAKREMEQRGVTVKLKTEISGAGDGFVRIKGQADIPTHLLIWAGGVSPSPVVTDLDCDHGHHGGVLVDGCCAVPHHPGVWALGDCAEIPQPDGKRAYAPTAQNAIREGTQVARNIAASLAGKKPEPFVFTPIGELAIVGKRAGVARVYGMEFSGQLAWAMWRAIYLIKMPSLRKQVRVVLGWGWDTLFDREVSVLPTAQSGATKP